MASIVVTMPILVTEPICEYCGHMLWVGQELKVEKGECKTLVADCSCGTSSMMVIAHKSYFEMRGEK
jgi:RNase P subunit RPR2